MTTRCRLAAVALAGMCLALSIRPADAQDRPVLAPEGAFAGKFAAVTFKSGDRAHTNLLAGVTVRRLGGREFLVGKMAVGGEDEVADWQGVESWVPIDGVALINLFGSREQAIRAIRAVARPD